MNDWASKSISGNLWIWSPYLTWLDVPPVIHLRNSQIRRLSVSATKLAEIILGTPCFSLLRNFLGVGCYWLLLLARWTHIFNVSIWESRYLDIANKRNKMNGNKQYLIWNKPKRVFYQHIHQNCTITVQHLRRGTYCIIMYLVERSKIEQSGKAKIRRRVNDDKTIYRKLYAFVLNTF